MRSLIFLAGFVPMLVGTSAPGQTAVGCEPGENATVRATIDEIDDSGPAVYVWLGDDLAQCGIHQIEIAKDLLPKNCAVGGVATATGMVDEDYSTGDQMLFMSNPDMTCE